MARRQRGEGAVYQRCSDRDGCPPVADGQRPEHHCRGRWVGALDLGWHEGKRVRRVVYGRTQREAARRLAELRQEAGEHAALGAAGLTVEQWLTHWLDSLAADRAVARGTLDRSYRPKMAHVIERIGKVRLDALEADHVRRVYRWMADQGRAHSYIVQTHRILSHALKDARLERRVRHNVMELVRTPKVGTPPKDTPPVTREQAWALVGQIAGDRLESRWLFQLTTGVRQGEVLGLGWEDIDLDTGQTHIRRALQRLTWQHGCGGTCGRKGGWCPQRHSGGLTFTTPKSRESRRVLWLPPALLESLRARHEAWLGEEHPDLSHLGPLAPKALVWGQADGQPRDAKDDMADWSALLTRAGIPHMGTHSSRHGVASLLSELGEPVRVTQAILGHADPALTMRVYTHTDTDATRRALAAVETALRQGQTAIDSAQP